MKTQGDWEAGWKYWRWDRTQPFKALAENGALFLESKDWSALDGEHPDLPTFALYIRFDECSHLNARIDRPNVEGTWYGRPVATVSDYMHICGAGQFDLLINLLTEAKAIAYEWYGGYAGFWEAQ